MDRSALVAVALVAMVALSGCSGLLGGDGTPTANATPDVTTTSAPGDGPFDDVAFPDGASADGITDREVLVANHQEAIAGDDYAVAYSLDYRDGDRVPLQRSVRTSSSLDGRQSYSVVTEPDRVSEAYRNGTTFASREFRNDTTYVVRPLDRSFEEEHARLVGSEAIAAVLQNGEYRADAVVTRRDGAQFVRYQLEAAHVNESRNASVATGSMLVGEDGVVYSASLRIEGGTGDERYLVDVRYRVVRRGNVTIDRPAWVDEAVERTGGDGAYTTNSSS